MRAEVGSPLRSTRGTAYLREVVGPARQTGVMAKSLEALVKPELLAWARTKANLEPLAAQRKIDLPYGRIEEWEEGSVRPTVAQLRKAAKVYRRPLAAFFLSVPPQDFETLRDFRRFHLDRSEEWSAALHAEYRRAHFQRDALLEIAELDDAEPPHQWGLTHLPEDDTALAARARSALLALAPLPPLRPSADQYQHLNFWAAALEESGVLVMTTEDGRVLTDEMRAFSLYFEVLPVVMLNGADWPRGRLFSLLHEYAHLILHTAGLCDTTTDMQARTEARQIEARCNALAAAILMPAANILGSPLIAGHERDGPWDLSSLVDAARPFGVSVEAFLRRLVTLGVVPLADYQDFRKSNAAGGPQREKAKSGNANRTKARDLGKGYVRVVCDAHRRALIDTATAATFLDVRVERIAKLAQVARI